MKTTYIIAVGIACAVALFSGPLTAKSPEAEPVVEKKAKPAGKEQRLVRIYESSSMLMKGDPELQERMRGDVLPAMLADGWKIVQLDADAVGDGGTMVTTGYLLLER